MAEAETAAVLGKACHGVPGKTTKTGWSGCSSGSGNNYEGQLMTACQACGVKTPVKPRK